MSGCSGYRESYFEELPYASYVICAIGFLGNVLEIITFRSKIFGKPRFLLIAMATMDLISLAFRVAYFKNEYRGFDVNDRQESLRHKLNAMALFFRNIAMNFLIVLAFVRYRSVVAPFASTHRMTLRLTCAAVCTATVPVLLLYLPVALPEWLNWDEAYGGYYLLRIRISYYCLDLASVLVATILLVAFNFSTIHKIRNGRFSRQRNFAVCTKIIVLGSFSFIITSALPRATSSTLDLLWWLNTEVRTRDCTSAVSSMFIRISKVADTSNSACVDNLVYLCFSREYRMKACSSIAWICGRKKLASAPLTVTERCTTSVQRRSMACQFIYPRLSKP